MKNLIILVVVGLIAFKGYEMHKAKEAAKPFGIYKQLAETIVDGKHNDGSKFIEGDKAAAELARQKAQYRNLELLGSLGTVAKTSYVLKEEVYEGENKVKIKVFQVVSGGPGRVGSPVSAEHIERNHEAVLIKTANGWKVSEFQFSLASPIVGNRTDWTGML